MAQIDQMEKAELRDLSFEEMEHVSAGETFFQMVDEIYLMINSYKYPMAKGPLK